MDDAAVPKLTARIVVMRSPKRSDGVIGAADSGFRRGDREIQTISVASGVDG